MTNQLIQDTIAAMSAMAFASRITPFSAWYKGDHARARTALAKAFRALIKRLRSTKEHPELLASLQKALDGLMAKAGGSHGLKAQLQCAVAS